MVSSHCFLIPDYPFWALLLRWVLMIRISNSSTVNFDKNSLSTVYWIGSFFSKLYRPPCYSYLFSTYAKGLIQYAYSLFFSEAIRWLLDKLHWNLTIPILMGEPYHTGVSLFWYTGHGSNFSNSRLRITGMVARSLITPFIGHGVPVRWLTVYQTYLITLFSFQRTLVKRSWNEVVSHSVYIRLFHSDFKT